MLLTTLKDTMHGPEWITWVILIPLIIASVVLLTGHGANLIAGYNTASKEEKEKYNSKKLCRVTGIGMMIICILILIMELFATVLPASFAYVCIVVIVADCLAIIILCNTICRK